MQTSQSTLATVQHILAEEVQLPATQLVPDRNLDELGVDSLAVIEVMFKLENAFQIEMPREQVPVLTVQDIVDLVERQIAVRGVSAPVPEAR